MMMINGAASARMDACWRVLLAPARNPHVLPTRNNCCCAHMFATIEANFMLYLIKREIRRYRYRAARGNARPGAMPAFLMQHQNFNTQ
jgi:hypothetical protein